MPKQEGEMTEGEEPELPDPGKVPPVKTEDQIRLREDEALATEAGTKDEEEQRKNPRKINPFNMKHNSQRMKQAIEVALLGALASEESN